MDDGGALGVAACPNRSQHSGDAGADVLTKQHVNRVVETDDSASSQCLQDAHRGGGGLDDGRKDSASQDAQQRIAELGDDVDEHFRFPQGSHGRAHHIHADEQNAQTGKDLSIISDRGFLDEHHQNHADKSKQGGDFAHIQSDELAGDGSADVGTHNDPYSLPQSHHAGVNESHHHDRSGGGGLYHGGDTCAHEHTQNGIGCEPFQNAFHSVAGGGFQTGTHHLHTIQEESQAA